MVVSLKREKEKEIDPYNWNFEFKVYLQYFYQS